MITGVSARNSPQLSTTNASILPNVSVFGRFDALTAVIATLNENADQSMLIAFGVTVGTLRNVIGSALANAFADEELDDGPDGVRLTGSPNGSLIDCAFCTISFFHFCQFLGKTCTRFHTGE